MIHNLEQNGTNTSNLNANINPSVESTDENSSELIGKFNELAVVVVHQLLENPQISNCQKFIISYAI